MSRVRRSSGWATGLFELALPDDGAAEDPYPADLRPSKAAFGGQGVDALSADAQNFGGLGEADEVGDESVAGWVAHGVQGTRVWLMFVNLHDVLTPALHS